MNSRKILGVVTLAAGVVLLAGCTASGAGSSTASTTSSTSTSTGPSTTPDSSNPTSVATVSSSGACNLLTASDVQSALSESVTASRPLTGASAGAAGQIEECILTTDGPAMNAAAASTIGNIATGLLGASSSDLNLTSGGIAILQVTTTTPVTGAPSSSSLPGTLTSVPGVGQQAYVYSTPIGGGVGFVQTSSTNEVLIMDLEGKQVTTAQLTALITAVASHS
jgi:hypothetical protein